MKKNNSESSEKNKNKIGDPSMGTFKFSPRSFGQLNDYVIKTGWNSILKVLEVSIYETPKLEVMKWINYLCDQHLEYQRSPFVDTNNSTLVLDVMDSNELKIATLRFKNLKVENHECVFDKKCESKLKHDVSISYQHIEVVVHKDKAIEDDDEWKEEAGTLEALPLTGQQE